MERFPDVPEEIDGREAPEAGAGQQPQDTLQIKSGAIKQQELAASETGGSNAQQPRGDDDAVSIVDELEGDQTTAADPAASESSSARPHHGARPHLAEGFRRRQDEVREKRVESRDGLVSGLVSGMFESAYGEKTDEPTEANEDQRMEDEGLEIENEEPRVTYEAELEEETPEADSVPKKWANTIDKDKNPLRYRLRFVRHPESFDKAVTKDAGQPSAASGEPLDRLSLEHGDDVPPIQSLREILERQALEIAESAPQESDEGEPESRSFREELEQSDQGLPAYYQSRNKIPGRTTPRQHIWGASQGRSDLTLDEMAVKRKPGRQQDHERMVNEILGSQVPEILKRTVREED